jgi:hypothetical protein
MPEEITGEDTARRPAGTARTGAVLAHSGADALRPAFLQRAHGVLDRLAGALDDDAMREAIAADSDAAVLAALGLVQTDTEPSGRNSAADRLAAARARGEQAKRDLLAAQGDLLDAATVAARLGIDVAEVERQGRAGALVALPLDSGELRFPAWQFSDRSLLPGLHAVLRALGERGPWSRVLFLVSGDPYLGGRTPVELLQQGEIETVRRLAEAYDDLVAT